jgi:endo-1,4-beta-xylanase
MSRRRFLKRSVAAAAGVLGASPASARGHHALRDLAARHNFWIGAAVAYSPLTTEVPYRDILAREFNILTPDNALKWAATEPHQDQYTLDQADTIVNFGLANSLVIHGHNLCWEQFNPTWLTSGNFSRDDLIAILCNHIFTVAGRYSGDLVAWDVVNEAVAIDGSLAPGIWRDGLGPDYLDWAYQFARAADPGALLVYNDWGAEGVNTKSTAIYNLIADMLDRGIPIDGIGFQMHIDLNGINYASFAQNLQRFANLGLALFVTEMDVRIQLPATADKLARQAQVYRNVLSTCLDQSACRALQMWGFTDKYSWIPGFYPGYGAALIFDENYPPKPAYYALRDELRNRNSSRTFVH